MPSQMFARPYLKAECAPESRRLLRIAMIPSAAVLAGLLALLNPGVSLATMGASVLVASLVSARNKLLFLLLLAVWYLPGQTAPGGLLESYTYFRWIGVPLTLSIAMAYFAEIAIEKKKLQATEMALPMFAFFLIASASTLLNGTGFLGLASILALYLRYPLLFIAIANSNLRESDVASLVKFFLLLSFVQIPEILWRYFALNAKWDDLSWTLGPWGTFPLGVYCVSSACLLAGRMVEGRFKPLTLMGIPLLLIPALLGEIKSLLISAPICALAVLLYPWRRRKIAAGRLVAAFAAIASAIAIFLAWSFFWGANDELNPWIAKLGKIASGDPRNVDFSRVNRLGWTIDAASKLASEKAILLGQGPGSSLSGTLTGEPGRLASPNSQTGKTQISAMLYDVGVLGLGAFLFLLFAVLKQILKAARTLDESADKSLVYAMLGIWVFYVLLGPQYDLVWRSDAASFPFWVFAAGSLLAIRGRSRTAVSGSRSGGEIENTVFA